MTALGPLLQGFFTERLIAQRGASPNTVAAYRDSFRLLLVFACSRTAKTPSGLALEDLDAGLVSQFLDHLETDRHNTVRTRNARLAAVHSLFGYAALRHPDHAELIARVLAIPPKRTSRDVVCYLTDEEAEALLASPDRSSWIGRRDRTLLLVLLQTGLRVSELTGVTIDDVVLGTGAHVRCHGKGRKERITPLTSNTVAALRTWLIERGGAGGDPAFPTRRGGRLSRDAVELLVAKYATKAVERCPSLRAKTVNPHVLRHTCAMRLLAQGIDSTVIALLLGHESVETTQIYVHADMTIKERALARLTPLDIKPGRYRPSDALLAFLEAL
jgi:integrase/recombinase XerD